MKKYSKLEEYYLVLSIPIGILAVVFCTYTFIQGYQANNNHDKFFGISGAGLFSFITIMRTRDYNRLREKRRNLSEE
jgi:hypothetical protein